MLFKIVLILLILALLICLLISYGSLMYITKPKTRPMDEAVEREKKAGYWDFYEPLEKEDMEVTSYDGYVLHGTIVKNTGENAREKDWVIITHGYTSTRYGSLKYIPAFYELGYQIYIYDDRNHGANKKCFTSMGYYETGDLIAVKDALKKRFGDDITIGLHGESMGCAISLMALERYDGFKFLVADCGYADLASLLDYQLKSMVHLPVIFGRTASLLGKLLYGFELYRIRPCDAIRHTRTPILFIHGAADGFIPKEQSQLNYDSCEDNIKELYFIEGADHAASIDTDPKKYHDLVVDFVSKTSVSSQNIAE